MAIVMTIITIVTVATIVTIITVANIITTIIVVTVSHAIDAMAHFPSRNVEAWTRHQSDTPTPNTKTSKPKLKTVRA